MNFRIGTSNIFLIGSLHILPTAIPLSLDIQRSLVLEADEVIFESDLEHPPQPDCHLYSLKKLSEVLDINLFQKLLSLAADIGFEEPIEKLKPWFLNMLLSIRLQLHCGASLGGIDKSLWEYSKNNGKRMFVLEQAEVFNALDAVPVSESINGLKRLVEFPKEPIEILNIMYQAWQNSDLDALNSVIIKTTSETPAVARCLFDNRNRLWISSILSAIKKGRSATFVVGCGHIAFGKASLRSLLWENGFELTAVG